MSALAHNVAQVSVWRNNAGGKTTGTMFGFRLGTPLRDAWVDQKADFFELELESGPTLKILRRDAFWNKCPEFKHPDIGEWLRSQGVTIPWPRGEPPKFEMERINGRHFKVRTGDEGA